MASIKTIIMIGPPGSGKGTQAELLATELNAIHLSSGQVLRQQASVGVQDEMEAGKLVQEGEVDRILEASLRSAPAMQVWILDGYIRLEQDKVWLERVLAELGRAIDVVIVLDVAEEVCRERVLSRGRDDDTDEAWEVRWREFERITMPVIASLGELPNIHIDGSTNPEIIQSELLRELRDGGFIE